MECSNRRRRGSGGMFDSHYVTGLRCASAVGNEQALYFIYRSIGACGNSKGTIDAIITVWAW